MTKDTDIDAPPEWMSMRDHAAIQFMVAMLGSKSQFQGLVQSSQTAGITIDDAVAMAGYEYADAMLRARGEA